MAGELVIGATAAKNEDAAWKEFMRDWITRPVVKAVSYTHLDVYKRQVGKSAIEPSKAPASAATASHAICTKKYRSFCPEASASANDSSLPRV